MITKVEGVCLCVTPKKWEIKDKGTSGISYYALLYADKKVTSCKTEQNIYDRLKDKELVKGIAIVEIQETNYNGIKGVSYLLKEFGETK